MFHPDRVSTLSSMSNPRRPHRLPLDAGVSKAAWAANDELAEQRILEIAELAFILEVDGFPVPEIFRRVGLVHPPMPPLDRLCPFGNPLHDCVVENLRADIFEARYGELKPSSGARGIVGSPCCRAPTPTELAAPRDARTSRSTCLSRSR